MIRKKSYLGAGIVLGVIALAISMMCIAFSYADATNEEAAVPQELTATEEVATDPEDIGEASEEEVVDNDINATPTLYFDDLPDDYEIILYITNATQGVTTTHKITEKSYKIEDITSAEYHPSINLDYGSSTSLLVAYQNANGDSMTIEFIFRAEINYLATLSNVPSGNVPSSQDTRVTLSFTKADNPKYFIEVVGEFGNPSPTPLEGVDLWYMSNDKTIFPTVSTVKNAAGDKASAKLEVSSNKVEGYFDISYSKLEPNTVYDDDIDVIDYYDYKWDAASHEFVCTKLFNPSNRSASTLLLTSDGNLKYFTITMTKEDGTHTYCSPRISYNLSGGSPVAIPATCNISDGGDVTCIVDSPYVKMTVPVTVVPKDGYKFDYWEKDNGVYRSGDVFIINDIRELTVGKIHFISAGGSEIAQTGDVVPFAVLIGLGLVAIAAFAVARKQYNR